MSHALYGASDDASVDLTTNDEEDDEPIPFIPRRRRVPPSSSSNVPRNGEPNVILDTLSDEDDVRPPPSLRRLDIVDLESDDESLNSINIEGRSSLFLAPPCMICIDVLAKRACLITRSHRL